jgi:hypothetical protein
MEKRVAHALSKSMKVLRSIDAGHVAANEANARLKRSRAVLLQLKKELGAQREKCSPHWFF